MYRTYKLRKAQRDVIASLTLLWEKYPRMRFGQLLENYVAGCPGPGRGCISNIPDKEILERMKTVLKRDAEWI